MNEVRKVRIQMWMRNTKDQRPDYRHRVEEAVQDLWNRREGRKASRCWERMQGNRDTLIALLQANLGEEDRRDDRGNVSTRGCITPLCRERVLRTSRRRPRGSPTTQRVAVASHYSRVDGGGYGNEPRWSHLRALGKQSRDTLRRRPIAIQKKIAGNAHGAGIQQADSQHCPCKKFNSNTGWSCQVVKLLMPSLTGRVDS